jgi:iron complex outermembrane recepter protein
MQFVSRSKRTLRQKLRGALSPSIAIATTLCLTGFGSGAQAQTAPAGGAVADGASSSSGNEVVIVTGTRKIGMVAADSPAPVQVVSGEVLQETGASDLMNALATQTPSFNANQTGGDMASQTLTAQMRALSPNHALVLVNGKRRHVTSNVGASSGAMAADMSFIPTSAIKRVEVLTDGAAALYGSDAIAGVFNVILKNDYEGGSLNAGYSEYGDGGGATDTWQGNWGFGNSSAYINVAFDIENRDTVGRAVAYGPATCVANAAECQAYLDTGYQKYGSSYRNGSLVGYLAGNDVNMALNSEYPYLNHVGDPPEIHRQAVMYNSGWHINDKVELYSYGSLGAKSASSYETYRRPTQDGGVDLNGDGDRNDTVNGVIEKQVNKYPYGFTPNEESDERDLEFAFGAKGETAGWAWDLATVYGKSKMDVFTTNSMNFTLWNETGSSPENFYDGSYWSSQWTTSANVSKDFNIGLANPMTFATGVEYRIDEYGIKGGEPASYYGSGASSFPGYNPAVNTGSYDRDSYAAFANVILEPAKRWIVDLAARAEHYSDFGDQTIGKVTTRFDVTDSIAFRGTASTGFRAPTLGEEYYSAVNVGPTSASPQLQPNGSGAAALGFGDGLQPETSTNYSAGFVLSDPIPNLTMTLDAYQITIDDRILRGSLAYSTGQGANTRTGCPVNPARPECLGLTTNSNLPDPADTDGDGTPDATYSKPIGDALVSFGYIGQWDDPAALGGSLDPTARANISISLFNNSLSTRTRGIDWVASYLTKFDWGRIDWSLSANYNEMKVLEAKAAPAILGGATMYSAITLKNMETSNPDYRINLGARISVGDFTFNVRETVYGSQYTLSTVSAYPQAVKDQLDIVNFNGVDYYKVETGVMALMNLEATWKPTDSVRITIGADNVFNQYPNKTPKAIWDYTVERYSNSQRQYVTGSPVGYFGRKLFAKISKTF